MSNELDDLRDELQEFAAPTKPGGRSAREERIIAGFEDIQRFVEQHQRPPLSSQDHEIDIFERIYAVRLERLKTLAECRAILLPLDRQNLLGPEPKNDTVEDLDDEALMAELKSDQSDSISELRFVRSHAEKSAAEEIARQQPCRDFGKFAPLFEKAERELKSGERQARAFGIDASINEGGFFVLGGQTVYVAGIGEYFKGSNGGQDARLRLIYANGTESDLLLRSLQRALYKDEAGRRLSEPSAGPLFADTLELDDIESGHIYVLRSHSEHPFIAQHRALIHKIGVTGRSIASRIANARLHSTYLFADVEIVASYQLAGVNRTKLENIFHRIFSGAQLDVTLHDPFGAPLKPREWFLVPLPAIDEAVQKILDGSIVNAVYNPNSGRIESV